MHVRVDAKEFEVPDEALTGADQLIFTVVQPIVMIPDAGQMRLKKIAGSIVDVDAVVAGKRLRVWSGDDTQPIPELSGISPVAARWWRPAGSCSSMIKWGRVLA